MGSCLGSFSLANCASCLCGSSPCLLLRCCPCTNTSIMTRLAFSFFLFLGTMVSIIMVQPSTEAHLRKIPGFCLGSNFSWGMDMKTNCDVVVGYKSVYRMCFGMACFFTLFSIIMVRVRTSRDPRTALHNGFWFFKFLVLLAITVGAFFIHAEEFDTAWYWIGLLGSFLFIIIQLILMVDFTYCWNKSWMEKAEDGKRGLLAALVLCTVLFYSLALIIVVLLYIFYTRPDDCTENKLFISFNLIFCFVVSIVSVLPKVQNSHAYCGLLQSSVISFYAIYLTWSGLTNHPNHNCNPSLMSLVFSSSTADLSPTPEQEQTWNFDGILGLVISSFCILYSSIRLTTKSQLNKLLLSGEDDGMSGVTNRCSFFHFCMALASLYIMMTITDWYQPVLANQATQSQMRATWVKMWSSWLGLAVYLWTLVAPIVCKNRDFT